MIGARQKNSHDGAKKPQDTTGHLRNADSRETRRRNVGPADVAVSGPAIRINELIMTSNTTSHRTNPGEYIQCEYSGEGQTDWSVKVDEDGELIAVECSRCGGSNWRRVP